MHIKGARTLAPVFAFAGAVFPDDWRPQYAAEINPLVFEFAFHARRINQLGGLTTFPSIKMLTVKISQGDPGNWEDRYKEALHALHHARTFVLHFPHTDHKKLFSAADNVMPLYLKVGTYKYADVATAIFFVRERRPIARPG
jgi:hypothetical protein